MARQKPLPAFRFTPTASVEMALHGMTRPDVRKVLEHWWAAGGHLTGAIQHDLPIGGRKLIVRFEYEPGEAPPIAVFYVGWY